MKILVIPTTDWIGHPVPNRLNFIFDRLADKHQVDVCHFKMFEEKKRKTNCNLIDMGCDDSSDVGFYYLKNFKDYSTTISNLVGKYDVVISANIIPSAIANLNDTPIIIDYLDHFPQSASSYYKKPMDELAAKSAELFTSFNLKKSDGLITPTDGFRNYLEKKVDKKIKVVPNGIDLDVIGPADPSEIEKEYSLGRPVLGYVGSLEKWVDLDGVIKMMPSIKDRYPNATLLIVGPDLHTNHSEYLKNLSEKLGVEEDIIFTGRVDYEDLPPYISAMDVGLNPRKPLKMNRLTMGSKVLSYLACGVPVLSQNMPEIEKKFRGYGVHRYDNAEDFFGVLAKSLTEDVHPDVVTEYDWNILSKKYEKAIFDLID